MKIPKVSPIHLRHAARTALAAVTTYALGAALGMDQRYWAVISVVIVMQANLGGSIQAGVNRILGTAVGAFMGAACLNIFGVHAISLGIGIGLTILICAYFVHRHESFRLAGLTATIVILFGNQSDSYMKFALQRFLEIGLGVGIALIFSLFVWPSRAGRQLKKGVVDALNDEAALYSILFACRHPEPGDREAEKQAAKKLFGRRETNRTLLEEAKREPVGLAHSEHITVSLFNFTERIAEHLLSMRNAIHYQSLESLHPLVDQDMEALAQTTVTVMTRLALSISQDHDPGPVDDLNRAMVRAEDALTRLRQQQTLPSQSLESVMRFYSFYYNMRQVAVELEGMAERAAMLTEE